MERAGCTECTGEKQAEKTDVLVMMAEVDSSESDSTKERVKPCLEVYQILVSKQQSSGPRVKVVCKLCKLQETYHSTMTNLKSYISKMCTEMGMARGQEFQQSIHVGTFYTTHNKHTVCSATRGLH